MVHHRGWIPIRGNLLITHCEYKYRCLLPWGCMFKTLAAFHASISALREEVTWSVLHHRLCLPGAFRCILRVVHAKTCVFWNACLRSSLRFTHPSTCLQNESFGVLRVQHMTLRHPSNEPFSNANNASGKELDLAQLMLNTDFFFFFWLSQSWGESIIVKSAGPFSQPLKSFAYILCSHTNHQLSGLAVFVLGNCMTISVSRLHPARNCEGDCKVLPRPAPHIYSFITPLRQSESVIKITGKSTMLPGREDDYDVWKTVELGAGD